MYYVAGNNPFWEEDPDEETCPHCGSDNFEYWGFDLDNHCRKNICNDCGGTFKAED